MNTARRLTHVERLPEEERRQQPLEFRLILRLVHYLKPYPRHRNGLILLVLVRGLQLAAIPWAIGAIIKGPITNGEIRETIWAVAGFGLLIVSTNVVMSLRQRISNHLGELVSRDLRTELFEHVLSMPMEFFDQIKVGHILSRTNSDVEHIRIGIQNVFFISIVNFGQMTLASLLMLWCDPMLFAIILGMAPILWFLNRVFRSRFSRAVRAGHESMSRVTATLAESVQGIRVTQGFARQDQNAMMFQELVDDHSRHSLSIARSRGMILPLMDLNSQIFIACLVVVGGLRILSPAPDLSLGELVQFLFLAGIFFQPIQALGGMYEFALNAMGSAERVFRILDQPPAWDDDKDADDLDRMEGRVQCHRLTFGYDPGNPVLHDIDLTVEPGQTIALVGQTGSGKSTLVKLIAKFYLPTAGQILIDDRDIRSIRSTSIHRHMGIIQQENFLFSDSIAENIRIGKPDASMEDIQSAAETLGCLDLLESLPEGLDTQVGEGGTGLSLGQRQLVCFVRAMLANPQIFILDEATSSVDAMTESRIQHALETLLKDRTSFVIAHRLSTIRHADKVLVLDEGRIVESGTHIELLRRNGNYTQLYRQFARGVEPGGVTEI